jgi:hypothetical protein
VGHCDAIRILQVKVGLQFCMFLMEHTSRKTFFDPGVMKLMHSDAKLHLNLDDESILFRSLEYRFGLLMDCKFKWKTKMESSKNFYVFLIIFKLAESKVSEIPAILMKTLI